MKKIQLYTAALDNGGARHDAGAVLSVGNGKTQIDPERAKALVENGSAAEPKDPAK